jgi:hypothetical protein
MNSQLGEFNVLKRDGCVKEYGESSWNTRRTARQEKNDTEIVPVIYE